MIAQPSPAGPPQRPASHAWRWAAAIASVVLMQLGIVVLVVAIVLPLAFRHTAASGPQSLPTASPSETLQRNSDAWLEPDCDGFMSTTTKGYRDALGFTSCERFLRSAQNALDTGTEYHVVVESQHIRGAKATVTTTETYVDADSGEALTAHYEYELVIRDGAWLIDDDSLVDQSETPQRASTTA